MTATNLNRKTVLEDGTRVGFDFLYHGLPDGRLLVSARESGFDRPFMFEGRPDAPLRRFVRDRIDTGARGSLYAWGKNGEQRLLVPREPTDRSIYWPRAGRDDVSYELWPVSVSSFSDHCVALGTALELKPWRQRLTEEVGRHLRRLLYKLAEQGVSDDVLLGQAKEFVKATTGLMNLNDEVLTTELTIGQWSTIPLYFQRTARREMAALPTDLADPTYLEALRRLHRLFKLASLSAA